MHIYIYICMHLCTLYKLCTHSKIIFDILHSLPSLNWKGSLPNPFEIKLWSFSSWRVASRQAMKKRSFVFQTCPSITLENHEFTLLQLPTNISSEKCWLEVGRLPPFLSFWKKSQPFRVDNSWRRQFSLHPIFVEIPMAPTHDHDLGHGFWYFSIDLHP